MTLIQLSCILLHYPYAYTLGWTGIPEGKCCVFFIHHYTPSPGTVSSRHLELVGEKLHWVKERCRTFKPETHLLHTYCALLPEA